VKRAGIAFTGLALTAAITAVAVASGVIPGTDGCVLRSVDKRDYVARNEAVFRTIELPYYLREAESNTYSVGISSPQACLPFENGPPYSSYVTWHVYLRPAEGGPYGFDRRLLGREWVSQLLGGGNEETFRRGDASLSVSFTDEATSFAVDHRRYAGYGDGN
jgi:hypothetical protein